MPALFEMASDDEAVAAVVALAAADDDRAVNAERTQQFRHAAAGVLHQHDAGDAELLDGTAIEITRLLSRQDHGDLLYLLIRRPGPFSSDSTSVRVIQAKSPGIECLRALAATP